MSGSTRTSREDIAARSDARELYWSEYNRARYRCPRCGGSEAIEVHHQDGDPFHNTLSNLIGLCHGCHRSVHRRWAIEGRLEDMRAEIDEIESADTDAQNAVEGRTATEVES